MKLYDFQPEGVCANSIRFGLEDGRLHGVSIEGGCPGNSLAIGKLVEGMRADTVVRLLKGNDCGGRGTSCADQFARAVEAAIQEKEARR